MTSTSLENALLDVRKAYRLLADYQQRMLELLSFIREEFGARHYHQHYRNQLPRSLDRLDRSEDGGARLLPFNDVSLLWLRDNGQEDPVHFHCKGDLLIDVWLRSDTGNGQDEEPLSPPETSLSQLRIYLFLCNDPVEDSHNWYHRVWRQTAYPELNSTAPCDGNPGYIAYGEAISLLNLASEADVRSCISDFRKRASAKLGQNI